MSVKRDRRAVVVRPVGASDLNLLYTINQAAVPGVGSVTRQEFTKLVFDYADVVLVALADEEAIGFVLCMLEGQSYGSPNYQWIADRYPAFAYVDRVAVSEAARGGGVGALLYREVFRHYAQRPPRRVGGGQSRTPESAVAEVSRAPGFRLGRRALGEGSQQGRDLPGTRAPGVGLAGYPLTRAQARRLRALDGR